MAFSRSVARAPLWGDGFDTDGWRDIAGVRSFETCAPDEMIRVFPMIARRDVSPAPAVVARIAECVAVLAWRSRLVNPSCPAPSSVSEETIATIGRSAAARWFPTRDHAWTVLVRALGVGRAGPVFARETEALALIDAIAMEIATGRPHGYESEVAARFAYWTGIHPVYLWPEALLSHDLYTAIGWIGHAERYTRALMTRDIADYFNATITRHADGATRVLDPRLEPYVRSDRTARLILTTARACLRGLRPIARLPKAARTSERVSLARGTP